MLKIFCVFWKKVVDNLPIVDYNGTQSRQESHNPKNGDLKMTSTIVLNHIATLWLNEQHGDPQANSDLYARMIKKASIMSSVGISTAYENRFEYIQGDAERERELALEYAEAIVECYKVRELAKLEKELEAAEIQKAIERNLAKSVERRAISDEVNAAREAVLEAAGDDKRAEAEARMRQLIKNREFASTEYRDALRALAQEYDDAIVKTFPVAVEYLRDCFLKCYDDVQIYGYSMALTFPRCRLVKDEASEAWREVEDKYWEQFRLQRNRNRHRGACEGENEIAQEFAEAVLPLCKPDELEKLELDVEEEKKRATICEECVEVEQRLRESAETKVELEEARARIWYAGDQYGYRKDQKRLDALRAIELCKEHRTASERVVKQLRAARESYDRDGFNALLERVNAPEWLHAYLTNNVSYGVPTKDAAQLMIDHCDVEKLEADGSKEWTDDDFAIDPRDAYVETMKAVAVEDMEEPEDVELDEYIKEYRAAHKETRARRLARSLRDFLWTRGFSLDDVGKAEWWQTVALRWPSLDEFVAVAKAGGLKNIDKYLRRGLRKANKRRAVRALLRIARAYAETCL